MECIRYQNAFRLAVIATHPLEMRSNCMQIVIHNRCRWNGVGIAEIFSGNFKLLHIWQKSEKPGLKLQYLQFIFPIQNCIVAHHRIWHYDEQKIFFFWKKKFHDKNKGNSFQSNQIKYHYFISSHSKVTCIFSFANHNILQRWLCVIKLTLYKTVQ